MAAPGPPDQDLDTATQQMLNSLTTVRGRTQLLHRRVRGPEPTHPEVLLASLSCILEAADALAHLIVSLRDTRPPSPPASRGDPVGGRQAAVGGRERFAGGRPEGPEDVALAAPPGVDSLGDADGPGHGPDEVPAGVALARHRPHLVQEDHDAPIGGAA